MRAFEHITIGRAQVVNDELRANLANAVWTLEWTNRPTDPRAVVREMHYNATTRPILDFFGEPTNRTHLEVAIDTLVTERVLDCAHLSDPAPAQFFLLRHRKTGVPIFLQYAILKR